MKGRRELEATGELSHFFEVVVLKQSQHGELMIRRELLDTVAEKIALASGAVPVCAFTICIC